jgi:membrane associated rhomboid family serine protease
MDTGYNFSKKKKDIKKIFDTPEYREYRDKRKKTQKRREKTYKFTSIGNSKPIIKYLILSNLFIFILSLFIPMIFEKMALYNVNSPLFESWQPITHMFLHGGFIHLLFNMFVLWSFGNNILQTINVKNFAFVYFASGIITGIIMIYVIPTVAVGASSAICGIFALSVFIFPNYKISFFSINTPFTIKHVFYFFAAISFIFSIKALLIGGSYSHLGHFIGMLVGYSIGYYWLKNNKIKKLI